MVVASNFGRYPLRMCEPAVVSTSFTQMLSFTEM